MNIFDRIATLFRANVNAAISEFEQPEKMLNQIILDMRSQLVRAKQQIREILFREKYETRLETWLKEIKQRAIIEVRM